MSQIIKKFIFSLTIINNLLENKRKSVHILVAFIQIKYQHGKVYPPTVIRNFIV